MDDFALEHDQNIPYCMWSNAELAALLDHMPVTSNKTIEINESLYDAVFAMMHEMAGGPLHLTRGKIDIEHPPILTWKGYRLVKIPDHPNS